MVVQTQKGIQAPTAMSETYNDWIVRCSKLDSGERVCELTQELRKRDTNQLVVAFAVVSTDSGAKVAMIAPFGVLLSEGIKILIGGQEIFSSDFRTCLPVGITVAADVSMDFIDTLINNKEFMVKMVDMNNQTINLTMSLTGFETGWRRLLEVSKSPVYVS